MEPVNRQESIELMERADLIMVDGDSEEAMGFLQRAVDIDPDNHEARRMLDGLLQRMNPEYVTEADRAKHISEEIDELVTAIQHARNTGQYELAHALCMRAMAIDPYSEAVGAEMRMLRAVQPNLPDLPPTNPSAAKKLFR